MFRPKTQDFNSPTERALKLTGRGAWHKVHHMVNYREARLDAVFSALSDPTRRAILARLARARALSVTALADPFAIKLPAVMKHLDVLDEAGLIHRVKRGRTVHVEFAAGSLKTAARWLERHQRFWSASLDRLAAYAEARERMAREAGR